MYCIIYNVIILALSASGHPNKLYITEFKINISILKILNLLFFRFVFKIKLSIIRTVEEEPSHPVHTKLCQLMVLKSKNKN